MNTLAVDSGADWLWYMLASGVLIAVAMATVVWCVATVVAHLSGTVTSPTLSVTISGVVSIVTLWGSLLAADRGFDRVQGPTSGGTALTVFMIVFVTGVGLGLLAGVLCAKAVG